MKSVLFPRALGYRAIIHIIEDPARHPQLRRPHKDNGLGTANMFAAHVYFADISKTHEYQNEHADELIARGGGVPNVAAAMLGLDERQSKEFFRGANTLEDIQRLVATLPERRKDEG